MIHRGSNPDVYVTWRDEFRASQGLHTSQNHESVLGVCSVPATCDRHEAESASGGRSRHTTNSPHQGTPGQHWTRARAMSAHFFTSLYPCFKIHRSKVERPDAHLSHGPRSHSLTLPRAPRAVRTAFYMTWHLYLVCHLNHTYGHVSNAHVSMPSAARKVILVLFPPKPLPRHICVATGAN